MIEKNTNITSLPTRNQHQPLTATEKEQDLNRSASRIGIVTGLRSMTPLALLAWTSDQEHTTLAEVVQERPSALKIAAGVAALGEIIGDKLPFTPSRLKTGPLVGRMAIGAFAGAIIFRRAGQSPVQGAIRGAIGAGIGSFIGYSYRTFFAQTTGIPDLVLATIEDAVALSLGWQTVQNAQDATDFQA
jgi:uncharacterized membrane protein